MSPLHEQTSGALPLLLVGVDFRGAPIELRERVAYSPTETEDVLVHLIAEQEIEETLLLATCNRTEVYLRHADEQEAFERGLDIVFLRRAPEIKEEGRFYVKRASDAVRHLLAVACGLESMVLGEPEILGQVKEAAAIAEALGTSGAILHRLAHSAAAAGRRARAETAIGAGAVSFGYAAVDLARSIFVGLERSSVLVLGAGETAVTVTRSLYEKGARRVRVANRSRERAEEFRREFPDAEAVPFADRLAAMDGADLVIAATGAPEPIFSRGDLEQRMRHRKNRPLLIVDLGVPRDVDPSAGELANVFLHDIDSLEQLIERNLKRRREEVPAVSQIVDEELERFMVWHKSLAAAPLVAQLHRRAEEIRRQELSQHRHHFPESTHEHLERLTRSIIRKILHHPSARLRRGPAAGNLDHLAAFRDLFLLDEDEEGTGS